MTRSRCWAHLFQPPGGDEGAEEAADWRDSLGCCGEMGGERHDKEPRSGHG